MTSGTRKPPPISTSSPARRCTSRPAASAVSTSSAAPAQLFTTMASSAPVSAVSGRGGRVAAAALALVEVVLEVGVAAGHLGHARHGLAAREARGRGWCAAPRRWRSAPTGALASGARPARGPSASDREAGRLALEDAQCPEHAQAPPESPPPPAVGWNLQRRPARLGHQHRLGPRGERPASRSGCPRADCRRSSLALRARRSRQGGLHHAGQRPSPEQAVSVPAAEHALHVARGSRRGESPPPSGPAPRSGRAKRQRCHRPLAGVVAGQRERDVPRRSAGAAAPGTPRPSWMLVEGFCSCSAVGARMRERLPPPLARWGA